MTFKFHTHNVHLFAYYLSQSTDSLSQNTDSLSENTDSLNQNTDSSDEYQSNWLWEKCDEIIDKILKPEFKFNIEQQLDLKNQPEEPWANLNKQFPKTDNYYPIHVQSHGFSIDRSSIKIDLDSKTAIIYPVQLYDSYGLGIKLISPKIKNGETLKSKDIALVNPNNCLILDEKKANKYFLGQTLLVTIRLEKTQQLKHKENKEKLQNIADNYIETLLPDDFRKPPFNLSGSLFGSQIFEYGIIRAYKSYTHIIIWFLENDKAEEKFDRYYQQLLDLFFFRAKIIHAYEQIKQLEKAAKKKSKDIQLKIKGPEKDSNELDLDRLQKLLIELPQFSVEHANNLRFIKEYQNIIIDNTKNYTDKISEIKSNCSHESDEKFSFLEAFTDRTCRPFQDRVRAAVNFFQLDINLINNAIDSIRGQVAIEQAHRERQLQITITSLGIGIATAGNFASTYEAGSISEKNPNDNSPVPFHLPHLILSFTITMLVGFIVWQVALRFFSWLYKEEQLMKNTTFQFNLLRFWKRKQPKSDQDS